MTAILKTILLIPILICIQSKKYAKSITIDSVKTYCCTDSILKYQYSNYNRAYELAIFYLENCKNKNNPIEKLKILQLAANLEYNIFNDYEKSIYHINQMKEIADRIENKSAIPFVNLNLANLYYQQKDYNKSLQLFEKAKKTGTHIGDSIIIYDALNGIADILSLNEKHDSALNILYKCMKYSKKKGKNDALMYIYDDIACIYNRIKKYDSAIVYYNKMLNIAESLNYKIGIIYSKSFSIYQEYLKDTSSNPIQVLKQLQSFSLKNKLYKQYYYIGYMISEILENKKKYKESLMVYKKTKNMEDSILRFDKIRTVAEIDAGYYLGKKEKENIKLTRMNEINLIKLKNRKIIIGLILFILIQAFILMYLLHKKYKTIKEQEKKIHEQEKEKIAQALSYKKRELAIKTLKIFHINQLLDDLSIRLNKLRAKIKLRNETGNELRDDIQSMLSEIRFSINNKIWEELEISFKDANPEFFKWLNINYPDLTLNEIKLCMFSMLQLETKEISIILMKTSQSIQVARTRLRKKLNINNKNLPLSKFLSKEYNKFISESNY